MKHTDPFISNNPAPYHFSNLTDQEYFNLHGTLTPERIQALIEQSALVDACTEAESALNDAINAYPGEDCLADVLKYVRSLAPYLNKAGQDALKGVICDIEVEQSALCNQGERGQEVINNFIASVDL